MPVGSARPFFPPRGQRRLCDKQALLRRWEPHVSELTSDFQTRRLRPEWRRARPGVPASEGTGTRVPGSGGGGARSTLLPQRVPLRPRPTALSPPSRARQVPMASSAGSGRPCTPVWEHGVASDRARPPLTLCPRIRAPLERGGDLPPGSSEEQLQAPAHSPGWDSRVQLFTGDKERPGDTVP